MHLAVFVPLIATALALPSGAASDMSKTGQPVARTHQFGIYLQAEEPYNNLVLRATQSGVVGSKYLAFQRPSAYQPSSAFLNGTSSQLTPPKGFAYLDFVSDDSFDRGDLYGAILPKVGNKPGHVEDVSASLNGGQAVWQKSADAKLLLGKQEAPSNRFWACNTTTSSKIGTIDFFGLKWGNKNADGSAPKGCVKAALRVVDNSFGSIPQ